MKQFTSFGFGTISVVVVGLGLTVWDLGSALAEGTPPAAEEAPPSGATGAPEPAASPPATREDLAKLETNISSVVDASVAKKIAEAEIANKSGVASVAAAKQAEAEERQLERLSHMYRTASGLFGQDHVLLSPIVYSGQRCRSGFLGRECDAETRNGAGGLVFVPLFGSGGGHGLGDWWPSVGTESQEQGFARFEREFRKLRDAAADRLDVPKEPNDPAAAQRRLDRLVVAFRAVMDRTYANDPYYHEDIARLKECLDVVVSAAPVTQDQTPSAGTPAEACGEGVKRAQGSPSAQLTLEQRVRLVEALWLEFDQLVDAEPVRRHNVLAGPAVGLPLTEDVGDVFFGAALEVGGTALRANLSGGIRSSMADRSLGLNAVGWFAGIGLSGVYAADTIDAINGAADYFDAPALEEDE